MTPLHLRVFLSSPGDVNEERAIVRDVAAEVQGAPLTKGLVLIEIVSWDDPQAPTPMSATQSPQLTVNDFNLPPSKCELTIVILWSRLGTPLPAHMPKDDGSLYASGTEWEFEDAKRGSKPVWIYHRTEEPRIGLRMNPAAMAQALGQYQAVSAFIETLRNDDGSLGGAVNPYTSVDAFKRLIKQHLEAEVRRRLEAAQVAIGDGRFRIFLAAADSDLRVARMKLTRHLKEVDGIELLPELPPPEEPEVHASVLKDVARKADLCVHLLGNTFDFRLETPDAPPELTYPIEQARLCLEHAQSQLVLQPSDFDAGKIANASYRQLIDDLKQRPEGRARLELVKTSRTQMLDLILAKRQSIERSRAAAALGATNGRSAAATAFVDMHGLDSNADWSITLRAHIEKRAGFRVATIDSALAEPTAPLSHSASFAQNLRGALVFVVVFGNVSRDWVDERLQEATKLIVTWQLPTKICVYLAPPVKSAADKKFPGLYVMDNTTGFDPAPIDPFLAQVKPQ